MVCVLRMELEYVSAELKWTPRFPTLKVKFFLQQKIKTISKKFLKK